MGGLTIVRNMSRTCRLWLEGYGLLLDGRTWSACRFPSPMVVVKLLLVVWVDIERIDMHSERFELRQAERAFTMHLAKPRQNVFRRPILQIVQAQLLQVYHVLGRDRVIGGKLVASGIRVSSKSLLLIVLYLRQGERLQLRA